MARKRTSTGPDHQQLRSPSTAPEGDVRAQHESHTLAERPLHATRESGERAAAKQEKGNSRRNTGLKYSVLLPTYNEAENIALIVWLLIRTFEEWCALRRALHAELQVCKRHGLFTIEHFFAQDI